MENEIWKDIIGYEGLYQVSSFSRVRGLDRLVEQLYRGTSRKLRQKGRMMMARKDVNGYLTVHLSSNGKKKHFTIHRLVAIAFIPNPDYKPEVNHKNGIKWDCRMENLEWNTSSENRQHAFDTGLQKVAKGKDSLLSVPVSQLTLDGVFVQNWACMIEVERSLGYSNANISKCVLGKAKTAYGFIWRKTV